MVIMPIKYRYGCNNEAPIPTVNPITAPIIVLKKFLGEEIITHEIFPIVATTNPVIAHLKANLYSDIG
jgi:hypothetical protein